MPPALVTAATTSRQWLKAKIGNSIPNISVRRFFMLVPPRPRPRRAPVVGLAARVARHLVDEVELPRHLVAGDLGAAVLDELVEGGRARPGAGSHDGGDPLAPPLVGDADDEGVEHLRVGLQRRLDLLGVDLLAARVDALRAAAEQRHRAVELEAGEVAGHRVALAVDRR